MKISSAGKICDHLWMLGREESCVYLLEGKRSSMIISGGVSHIVPDLLEQLDRFGIDEERISQILILHAHFDHVGIVPFFKRRNPAIRILASSRGWEILSMPKAIATINQFNRKVAARVGREKIFSEYNLDWTGDIKGETVHEGDRIDLGDVEIQILETPGHSSCSISAYLPRPKALFPSDGGGIPYQETIITSGNSNYTKFQQSLEKLAKLEVEYLCADHYGYIIGEEAKEYIPRAIELAKQRRIQMEKAYRKSRDIETAAQELSEAFYKEHPGYFMDPEIHKGVYRQMIRHIAAAMEEGP